MTNIKTAVIFARSFNRETGEPTAKTRGENINLETNELFVNCKTVMDIKTAYEGFWNELNPNSQDVVFVAHIVINKSLALGTIRKIHD